MMVMTSVSERPVTEPAGTIGAVVWLGSLRRERVRGLGLAASRASAASAVCAALRVGARARLRPVVGVVLQTRRACVAAASAGLSACHTIRT